MKVLIVDNEYAVRALLKTLLMSYCSEVETIEEASSVREGREAILKQSPDLVFLDVELGDGTGIELFSPLMCSLPKLFSLQHMINMP